MANKMQEILLDKLTFNIGIGSNEQQLQNAKALLNLVTGRKAVATVARKRNPTLKIKEGQAIGAMVTVRKNEAAELLRKALDAVNFNVKESSIRENTLSFGIMEYIDFPGIKYDPKIGMLGMNVNATFIRRGRRVALRKRKRGVIGSKHATVGRQELAAYLKENFKLGVVEE